MKSDDLDYCLEDLVVHDDNAAIEKKIKGNPPYAKVLLYINRKRKEGKTHVKAKEISKFFKWDNAYPYKMLDFFADCGLLTKVYRGRKDAIWTFKGDIERYVKISLEAV